MKRTICVAGLMAMLVSIAAAQAGIGLERELTNNLNQLVEAWKNRDVAYLQGTLTDDYLYVVSNGDTVSKAEVVQDLRLEPKETQSPRIYDVKVMALGPDAALVTYNTVEPVGHPRYQHLGSVWIRQNGQWKLKFQQSTPNLWSLADE